MKRRKSQSEELNTDSFESNSAMDMGSHKMKDKAKKNIDPDGLEALEGKLVEDSDFFNHDSRKADLMSGVKNHTPIRFALNSNTCQRLESEGVNNIRRVYGAKGIRASLVPETTEKDMERFMSSLKTITNEAIKLDNYDFFLRNNTAIRTNLARV